MKPDRSFMPHLAIREMPIAPAGEWKPPPPAWSFVHVTSGMGYWLHPRETREMTEGSVLVLSGMVEGCFRASQLGEVVLHFFQVEPERLTGLATLAEQTFLQTAAARQKLSLRVLPPTDVASEKFKNIRARHTVGCFTLRLQLLELFIETFGDEFREEKVLPAQEPDAKERLAELLRQMPSSQLLDMDFTALAQSMHCTPRHLSRVFRELVGASFRQKQTELRLARARELLATTESKVVEVALKSGYQSQSLFNLLFKRRFGISPAKWRRQQIERVRGRRRTSRLLAA